MFVDVFMSFNFVNANTMIDNNRHTSMPVKTETMAKQNWIMVLLFFYRNKWAYD